MILKIFHLYRQVSQGVKDPKGFAVDEAKGVFWELALIPGIILLGVVVLLGILSFTDWIVPASVLAQAFFWIFAVTLGGYITLLVIINRLINYASKFLMRCVLNKVRMYFADNPDAD